MVEWWRLPPPPQASNGGWLHNKFLVGKLYIFGKMSQYYIFMNKWLKMMTFFWMEKIKKIKKTRITIPLTMTCRTAPHLLIWALSWQKRKMDILGKCSQSGKTTQELKAVEGAPPPQTPPLWAQSGRTTQELKAVEGASPPQTPPLWAQSGRTTQELKARARATTAATEEFPQSIQAPSSTHPGTTYPVRSIPKSPE